MVRVANSLSLALPNDICCSKTLSGFTGILSDEILFESYSLVKPVNAQNWAISHRLVCNFPTRKTKATMKQTNLLEISHDDPDFFQLTSWHLIQIPRKSAKFMFF